MKVSFPFDKCLIYTLGKYYLLQRKISFLTDSIIKFSTKLHFLFHITAFPHQQYDNLKAQKESLSFPYLS